MDEQLNSIVEALGVDITDIPVPDLVWEAALDAAFSAPEGAGDASTVPEMDDDPVVPEDSPEDLSTEDLDTDELDTDGVDAGDSAVSDPDAGGSGTGSDDIDLGDDDTADADTLSDDSSSDDGVYLQDDLEGGPGGDHIDG